MRHEFMHIVVCVCLLNSKPHGYDPQFHWQLLRISVHRKGREGNCVYGPFTGPLRREPGERAWGGEAAMSILISLSVSQGPQDACWFHLAPDYLNNAFLSESGYGHRKQVRKHEKKEQQKEKTSRTFFERLSFD